MTHAEPEQEVPAPLGSDGHAAQTPLQSRRPLSQATAQESPSQVAVPLATVGQGEQASPQEPTLASDRHWPLHRW